VAAGPEGVVATATGLSRVDGERGELVIAGYPVEDLAPRARFEEVVYLLWEGRLPRAAELERVRRDLAARRALAPATTALLRDAARSGAPVMDALRMAAASASVGEADGVVPRAGAEDESARNASAAQRLVSVFPTIVGAYWRLRQGQEPVPPRSDLPLAASYLHQLFGDEPTPARVRGLETYLNTVADHGLNASTFTARVIVSTRSDFFSAITGAVGALKGPLHGGAPGPALDMVREIGPADRAEAVLREKLGRGERLMGFGHRVYRVRDPRADVLAAEAERFYAREGDRALYSLARDVERTALRLL